MAISIDYPTQVITIPRADLQLIQSTPTEIRQLDLDAFRLEIRDLEDDVEGMVYPQVVRHTQPVSISGVTLARVVEIINGYTVTFEDGQYAVNVVGGNTNIGDVVNVNQVSVRTSNSAGLTYSKQIEDQAFIDNRVFIDTANGLPGTAYPRGTPGDPVNNLDDAQQIIQSRNLKKRVNLVGALTVAGGQNVDDYDISGDSFSLSTVEIESGASSDNLVLNNCTLMDSVGGGLSEYRDSFISDVTPFNGAMIRCKLAGTTTVTGNVDLFDCYGSITLIAGIADINITVANYSGNITIANVTDGSVFITCISAIVTLHSSCTGGSITVADADLFVDNSTGSTVTVINKHDITQSQVAQVSSLTTEMYKDRGLDIDNPVTVTTNNINSVDTVVDSITKFWRKVGNVITITRQP